MAINSCNKAQYLKENIFESYNIAKIRHIVNLDIIYDGTTCTSSSNIASEVEHYIIQMQ